MHISIEVLIVLTELFLADFVLTIYQPRRNWFPLRVVVSLALSYGAAIFIPIPATGVFAPFRYCLVLLLTLLTIHSCFRMNLWSTLYWGIAGLILQHTGYSVIAAFSTVNFNLQFSMPFTVLVYGLVYLAEYLFITRQTRKDPMLKSQHKSLVVVSAVVILLNIFLNSMRSMYTSADNVELNLIASLYALFCCLLELALLLGIFQKGRLLDELDIVKRLWTDDKKQFESAQENMELLNIYCHDLKHIVRDGSAAPVDDAYRQNLSEALRDFDASITTNNHVLNVILTEKSMFCSKNHIKLTCMADGEDLDFIQTTDLYSMFGNLIDNAVEAVMKLTVPEQRIIALIVKRKGSLIYIHIENYFSGPLDFVDGLPRTTKDQAAYHGFGLKSVRLMAEKYGGNLSVGTAENIFYVNIMIPFSPGGPKDEENTESSG
ncbi:ATP-binding protein [Pseudoflavonifractor sp.]|jgi:hypothetical protein|uniref:ATP-binding protein n=1 Tax=Pseudoflavonifractor sp. TaxID=1980281 RepID=UPI003D8F5139